MVDYVKVATAGTTNLGAAAAWTPSGGPPVSVTNDTATFNTTSLGGSLTGNFTTRTMTINGATADVSHSGTITLGTGGWVFASTNNRRWTQTGTINVGSNAQTWALSHSGSSSSLGLSGATSLSGSGNITLSNNSGVLSNGRAYVLAAGASAGYTGLIILNDYTALVVDSATGALTGANFQIDGVGCRLYLASSNQILGAAGKTLTINNDVDLGFLGRSLTIAPNIVLGAVTRTLTVAGNIDVNGTVSGSAGVSINVTDASVGSRIRFAGASNGLTGPCTVEGNRAAFVGATTSVRYAPSVLTINTGGEFSYGGVTQDFTFPVAPTGVGAISITGAFAGNGCTFSSGLLDSFSGRLVAWPGTTTSSDNLVKLIIHQVTAGGLEWRGTAASSNTMVARITYANAANLVTSAPLLLDTYLNTTPASLTGGEFSLIVPSTSGTFQCSGDVTRQNSINTASARMNLTLGGSNTGDNTLSGTISEVGTNGAILGLRKVDAGRWVLSGSNTHTGQHEITGGTLSAQSNTALGAATQATSNTFTVSGSGVLELSGGVSLDKSGTDISLTNTNNPVQSVGGTNTLRSKQLSLASSAATAFNVASGNKLVLQTEGGGVIVGTSASLTKSGDGELELPARANTYNGTVTVSAGTLTVGSVANSGLPAAWGQGSTAVDVVGTLRYIGSAGSTNRSVRMSGPSPTINASGAGALTLNNVLQDTTTKTMTLRGTNSNDNKIVSSIADNGSGVVSLAKEDAGRWVLPEALSYTGTTAVNGGTLRIETTNSNTTSGAVTIGASGTVELITDTLASTSGSSGEVLGTGNVTVNGGTIKTRGGTTQKGQVRYGGNLTFGSGSKLYIGAAA